jgi:hypothetical protein
MLRVTHHVGERRRFLSASMVLIYVLPIYANALEFCRIG